MNRPASVRDPVSRFNKCDMKEPIKGHWSIFLAPQGEGSKNRRTTSYIQENLGFPYLGSHFKQLTRLSDLILGFDLNEREIRDK